MIMIFPKSAKFWLKKFLDIKDGPRPVSRGLSWLDWLPVDNRGCQVFVQHNRNCSCSAEKDCLQNGIENAFFFSLFFFFPKRPLNLGYIHEICWVFFFFPPRANFSVTDIISLLLSKKANRIVPHFSRINKNHFA